MSQETTQSIKLRKVQRKISNRARRHIEVLKYLEQLKPLISDCVTNPMKKYTLKQWHEFLKSWSLVIHHRILQERSRMMDFG